jgi:hypothetical protein
MSECVFCKIVAGEIPPARFLEDERILAFDDINPQAPTHILLIPKKHIESLSDGASIPRSWGNCLASGGDRRREGGAGVPPGDQHRTTSRHRSCSIRNFHLLGGRRMVGCRGEGEV